MESSDLKEHAIAFADWKREWESCESHRMHRHNRKYGMAATIGPTTSELYDMWLNRSIMSFQEAMNIVMADGVVTRPRMAAVHESSIRLKDGIPWFYIEDGGFRCPYSSKVAYSDDQTATDWYQITNL